MKSRKIVVTRATHQAQELMDMLADRGAIPLLYPCIAIEPAGDSTELDTALHDAARGRFDWIILTSANTVWALRQRMDALGLSPKELAGSRVAGVGPATGEAAKAVLGLEVDLMPGSYTAESLARALSPQAGARMFLPQSRIARPVLADALGAAGAEVVAVAAYDTVIGRGGADVPGMSARNEIDAVTFTSSSTVRNFVKRIRDEGGDLGGVRRGCIACLGRTTAEAAEKLGFTVSVLPRRNALLDLVSGLERHFEREARR